MSDHHSGFGVAGRKALVCHGRLSPPAGGCVNAALKHSIRCFNANVTVPGRESEELATDSPDGGDANTREGSIPRG